MQVPSRCEFGGSRTFQIEVKERSQRLDFGPNLCFSVADAMLNRMGKEEVDGIAMVKVRKDY
jgi:hypothetical protein